MPRWLVKHCLWVHLRMFPEETDIGVSGLGEEDPSSMCTETIQSAGRNGLKKEDLLSLLAVFSPFRRRIPFSLLLLDIRLTTGSSTFGLWDLHQWLLGGVVRPDRDCSVSFPASRALNLDWRHTTSFEPATLSASLVLHFAGDLLWDFAVILCQLLLINPLPYILQVCLYGRAWLIHHPISYQILSCHF